MSARDDGGPAFPCVVRDQLSEQIIDQHFGVSLRDYFAAKALTIIAAASGIGYIGPAECASAAYEIADAMLAERAK